MYVVFFFTLYIVHEVQLLRNQEVMLAALEKIKQDLNLSRLITYRSNRQQLKTTVATQASG